FGDRHAAERPRDLEAARNAAARAHMGLQRRDVLVAEHDGAGLGAERAGNTVDQRGLAGAVRADEAEALARRNLDTDIVKRGETAKAVGERNDPQQRRRGLGGHVSFPSLRLRKILWTSPMMPSGAPTTNSTSITPSTSTFISDEMVT